MRTSPTPPTPDTDYLHDPGRWPYEAPVLPPLRSSHDPGQPMSPPAYGTAILAGSGLADATYTDPYAAGPPAGGRGSLLGFPTGSPLPPPPPLSPPTPPPARVGGGWRVACAALAAATLFSGGFAARGLFETGADPVETQDSASTPVVPAGSPSDEPAAAVASAVGPAVVQIEQADGVGSGVIYDNSGLIMTNAHVVGNARAVDVVLSGGTRVEGTVIGTDEAVDIAVIQIDPVDDMTVAQLATDVEVQVGQLAVALGSPFGLDQTVTSGIVSALDRPVGGGTVGMIQTDAPINPGNSGGALADRSGRVIGINASIYSESGENNGIGFAIPIDRALATADALVSGEPVAGAKLGVDVSADPDGKAGALVNSVRNGSAADDAGIEEGDRILSVDGDPVKDQQGLVVEISAHVAGDQVTLQIDRDGDTIEIEVELQS